MGHKHEKLGVCGGERNVKEGNTKLNNVIFSFNIPEFYSSFHRYFLPKLTQHPHLG